MGAIGIVKTGYGKSAEQAYNGLCAEAESEYGWDAYNGEINNCTLGSCVMRFAKYEAVNENKADAVIRKFDVSKDRVDYIDLGVTHFEVTEVKKTNEPYTAKYLTQFAVYTVAGKQLKTFETKKEADSYAEKHAKESGASTFVRRVPVLQSGNAKVSFFSAETVKVKKPTKKQEKDATAIHKYVFFGYAPC